MCSKALNEEKRTRAFSKDISAEAKLKNLNDTLGSISESLLKEFVEPKLPTIFIVGVPRSGSTLLSQIMASTNYFSYISNFSAKFWGAPYLGMLIEESIGLKQSGGKVQFYSDFGRTKGLNGPHEFGYFWQKWFKFRETHKVLCSDLDKIDKKKLKAEFAAMENVQKKPLFFKNLTCGLQIDFLSIILPNSFFILCERDVSFNMESILIGREKVHGGRKRWLSLKPKEYPDLKKLSPYEQVAAQIFYINQDIKTSFAKLGDNRKIRLKYEKICDNPRNEICRLIDLISGFGITMDCDLSTIPEKFQSGNIHRFKADEIRLVERAKKRYFGN